MPFITGKTYNLHWLDGLDFDELIINPYNYFETTDKAVVFRFNYSDNREVFEVCRNYGSRRSCSTNKLYEYNNTNHCAETIT